MALFLGPRQSGLSALDVDDMTEVEIRSHRFMASHCDFFRAQTPGFDRAYMVLSAPQLGVRHTRRLVGIARVERAQWSSGVPLADEIGVSRRYPRNSRCSPCPTARSCRGRWMACWPVDGTCPATPTRMDSCARFRSAGSPGRPPGWPPRWPSPAAGSSDAAAARSAADYATSR
jgi:hypothetical protein